MGYTTNHLSLTVTPRVLGKGICVPVPWQICKAHHIIAEFTQYVLEVRSDGTLVFTPKARPTPWAIGTPQVGKA